MTFKVIWWLNKIFYLDCDNGNKKKGYESLNIREVSHILSDYLQLHANHQNLSEFDTTSGERMNLDMCLI